jgi:hypothetical protein
VFNNLVNLCINWVKTAGSMPDAAMILGLFSQKNLKINIDRKLYWIVHLIVIKNMVVVFIRKNCIRMVFVYFAFCGLQEEFSTLPCSPCFTSKFWLLLS